MTMFLFAPWDLQEEGQSIQIQITGSNGVTALYQKTSGSFFTAMSATIEDRTYNDFLSDFTTYLSSSGLDTWNYRYSFASSSYIISCSSPSTGALLKFSPLAAQALGMANGTTSSQASYVSSTGSMFTWKSTEDQWTKLSYPYEGKTIVREQECDDGRVYALSNEDGYDWLSNIEGNYTWYDWQFALEPKANVFIDYSSSLNPNTYEAFQKQVRSYRPFVVFQPNSPVTKESGSYANRQGTYKIRADQSMFKVKPSIKDIDAYWTVDMQTRRLSQGNNFDAYVAPVLTSSFIPTQISGCYLWLRADLGVVLSGATDVVSWQDQSSNRHFFTQSVSTRRPNYQAIGTTTVFPTVPSIYFNRANLDNMTAPAVSSSTPFMYTWIVGGYQTARGAAAYNLFENMTSGSTNYIGTNMSGTLRMNLSNSNFVAGFHDAGVGTKSSSVTGSFVLTNNTPYVFYTQFSTYLSNSNVITEMKRNSTSGLPGSVLTSNTLPRVILSGTYSEHWIGARQTTIGSDFYFAEVIFYNQYLTQTQISGVNAYLATRYGVSL